MASGTVFCNRCGGQNPTAAQFCSNCGAPLAGSAPLSNVVGSGSSFATQSQSQSASVASPPQSILSPHAGYGGFWIRFVAAIIDGIIVQAVVMPVAFVVGAAIGLAGAAAGSVAQGMNIAAIGIGAVFGLFASWLYEAGMESSSRQATLGKMIFGMRVTNLQGSRISFAQATARHFCKYLSGMILFLGYIMAGFTERKRALHDMIAGTLVRR